MTLTDIQNKTINEIIRVLELSELTYIGAMDVLILIVITTAFSMKITDTDFAQILNGAYESFVEFENKVVENE